MSASNFLGRAAEPFAEDNIFIKLHRGFIRQFFRIIKLLFLFLFFTCCFFYARDIVINTFYVKERAHYTRLLFIMRSVSRSRRFFFSPRACVAVQRARRDFLSPNLGSDARPWLSHCNFDADSLVIILYGRVFLGYIKRRRYGVQSVSKFWICISNQSSSWVS